MSCMHTRMLITSRYHSYHLSSHHSGGGRGGAGSVPRIGAVRPPSAGSACSTGAGPGCSSCAPIGGCRAGAAISGAAVNGAGSAETLVASTVDDDAPCKASCSNGVGGAGGPAYLPWSACSLLANGLTRWRRSAVALRERVAYGMRRGDDRFGRGRGR